MVEMDIRFPQIRKEHLFFWNLWCLEYAFRYINADNVHYAPLAEVRERLWELNDNGSAFNVADFEYVLRFPDEDFEVLDDLVAEEMAVKEFVSGVGVIVWEMIRTGKVTGGKIVYTIPVNMVDVVLSHEENASVTYEDGFNKTLNMQEINAQYQLLELLRTSAEKYTFAHKDLFRL